MKAIDQSPSGNAPQETYARIDKTHAMIRRIEVTEDIRKSRSRSRLNNNSRSLVIHHILLSRSGALSKTTLRNCS